MTSFFLPGECSDRGYRNVRDGKHYRLKSGRNFTERLWQRYEPFADRHFRQDARAHFVERFWEMYLGVALLDRGLAVQAGRGKGPEFWFPHGKQKVWVEAVAPGPGTGADRVPETVPGVAYDVPTEKVLLRFATAVADKRRRYEAALNSGIVAPDDAYVLAINSRLIPHGPYGNTMPFFIQALLPFGNLTLRLNRDTRQVVDRYYEAREAVTKSNEALVSTKPLLDSGYSFLSAVIHSSVDSGNRPRRMGGDFSVLHNPLAAKPIDSRMLRWSEQYFYNDGELTRVEAFRALPRNRAQPADKAKSARRARGAAEQQRASRRS